MQIKRYEAKNMTLALRMVKEELGPDAVILSARSLRKGSGIFSAAKNLGVEVTAAVDGARGETGLHHHRLLETAAAAPLDAIQRYQKYADRKPAAPAPAPSKADPVPKRAEHRPSRPQIDNRGTATGMLNALHHQLLNQDVQRNIASALIEEIQRIPGIEGISSPQQIRAYLGDMLEEINIRFHPIGAGSESPKLIAFVGPPGVGKTATLAKLATRHAAAGRLKVALIGMDGYRIGAIQELQTYADIIDVPLAVLNTPAALRATLKKFKKFDVVYLDTAGIGFHDQERMTELQAALAKVKSKEVHLLLNATTRERDLAAVIERFRPLPLTCLGFTHLDECSTYGTLINVASQAQLPMSILTQGQSIPEDLQNGSIDTILDWLLQDFDEIGNEFEDSGATDERPRPPRTKRPIYVANRNSDVYHEWQCKWTRKIKPENMVGFATIEEAESKRYMPCRTCRPAHDSLDYDASHTRDRVILTSYR